MLQNFTFCPRVNPVGQNTYRTRVAQFGDGYAQRVQDGINAKRSSWPLEFVGSEEEIKPVQDFLDQHAGYLPFLWTPPLGTEKEFVTPEGYSLTAIHSGLFSLSVTLVQGNP